MNIKNTIIFGFCLMSFNTFAAGFCESKLDSIAAAAIKKSGVKTDETFNFEVSPLKPEQLVEERLSTYAVLGSDQTGPTHWLMVIKNDSCQVDYFKISYRE